MKKPFDIIGITDYRPEDYPSMLALAPDGGGLQKTFDEWKKDADAAVVAAAMAGNRVVRVLIDPDEFAAWLARNKLNSTPQTRARYVMETVNKKHGSN